MEELHGHVFIGDSYYCDSTPPTTDLIEANICADESTDNEDTPIELLEFMYSSVVANETLNYNNFVNMCAAVFHITLKSTKA